MLQLYLIHQFSFLLQQRMGFQKVALPGVKMAKWQHLRSFRILLCHWMPWKPQQAKPLTSHGNQGATTNLWQPVPKSTTTPCCTIVKCFKAKEKQSFMNVLDFWWKQNRGSLFSIEGGHMCAPFCPRMEPLMVSPHGTPKPLESWCIADDETENSKGHLHG